MENKDPPAETVARPRGKRVAHCLTCHHEWQPRDSTTEKPARCPECKKRNVKWRDLCTSEELELRKNKTVDDGKPVEEPVETAEEPESTEPIAESSLISTQEEIEEIKSELKTKSQNGLDYVFSNPDENLEDAGLGNDEPVTLEKIQESMKGSINGLPFVILLGILGAAGLVVFFLRRSKKKRVNAQRPALRYEGEEEEQNQSREQPAAGTMTHTPYDSIVAPWYVGASGLTARSGF